jgi:S1-C subfamily serine protease
MLNQEKRIRLGIFLLLMGLGLGAALLYKNFIMEGSQNQERVGLLEQQVKMLQDQVGQLSGSNNQFSASIRALENKPTSTSASNRSQSQEEIVTQAVATINPSVVSVRVSRGIRYRSGVITQRIGAGSGFIVSSDGYIVTNEHVVDYSGATYTVILPDGTEAPATLKQTDSENDIALLKIDKDNLDPVKLGTSSDLQLGQTVIAVGNALGEYSNSVSIGIVSGLDRTIEAEDRFGDVELITGTIQTDAAINPGNSGGPLVDKTGNVIGVNVATVLGSNSISFAIPIDVVRNLLRDLGI